MVFVYDKSGARMPNREYGYDRAYDAERNMELLCLKSSEYGRNGHRGGGGRFAFLHPDGKILMRFYEDMRPKENGYSVREYELFEVFCDPLVDEATFKPLIIEAVHAYEMGRVKTSTRLENPNHIIRIYFRGALHPMTPDWEKRLLIRITEDFREYMGYDV